MLKISMQLKSYGCVYGCSLNCIMLILTPRHAQGDNPSDGARLLNTVKTAVS